MRVPFTRDLLRSLSGLWRYKLRGEKFIRNKLFVKEHIVCWSVSGPSMVQIGVNATSGPSYAELHPPAAVIFITHCAAGHRYLGSVIFDRIDSE